MPPSSQTPVDRVTISSRSHTETPAYTPPSQTIGQIHHPGETVFDENEETESFYVILDITGEDFAASYGKYRDGRSFRPRVGDYAYSDDEDDEEEGTGAPPPDEDEVEEDDEEIRSDKDDEDDEGEGGNSSDDENGSSDSSSSSSDSERELSLQILDLDTYNPLVNYEGKIYSCRWTISNGTEMVFEAPPPDPSDNEIEDFENPEERDREVEPLGRRLRKHREAKLVATTIHRVEGQAAKVRPKGRDKQEVSTKARVFAERLDAVLEHRIKEMVRKGEDVSGVTMKKFSEGQRDPWARESGSIE
ncbi:hypothetical protein ABW19_dt0202211 [Dactylella cylindrospora]|nr:hypothetical protein ABW19_dt0202211 [Dactylella cylindrospora]